MFSGVYPALITPFTLDGAVDEARLRTLVDAQIAGGVSGLVPVGTTGESPTVSHEENIDVIRIVVDEAAGRVPVIAGTGSNSTQEAVEMTQLARELGASASLQVAPYYNKPSQEGLYRHFAEVADKGGLPVVVYNIPSRTGRNIETETMLRIAQLPGIAAVKEASGSLPQMMDLLNRKPESLDVLSGDDNMALALTLLGGSGVISVAANAAPTEMVSMISLALNGRVSEARAEHYRLLPFFKALFIDTNPIPIKYVMAKLGYCGETYRLPMCPLSDDHKRRVDEVLEPLNLQHAE
jgi:4-hydroxy-tetrahydrodipicolinate synthase